MNLQSQKTITGPAGLINQNMGEKCGGVVDEKAKKQLDANLENIRIKTMMKMK